jgi:DNA mismatch endonuclease (patch repair protein)
MVDILSPEMRSAFMARIRGVDTQPEIVVRKLLHRMGYRYKLHYSKLPGRPDLAFPSRRKVVFVHGCFWHSHAHCEFARIPKTRPDYWQAKFKKNKKRDKATLAKLLSLNWSALVIWECEVDDLTSLKKRLVRFLGPVGLRPR